MENLTHMIYLKTQIFRKTIKFVHKVLSRHTHHHGWHHQILFFVPFSIAVGPGSGGKTSKGRERLASKQADTLTQTHMLESLKWLRSRIWVLKDNTGM